MKSHLFPITICILSLVSCDKMGDPEPAFDMGNDPQTSSMSMQSGIGKAMKSGTFTSYEHSLMGNALFIADSAGRNILRLDKFTMVQGPDVRVFMSKSNNYGKANVIEVLKLENGYSNQVIDIEINSPSITADHKFVLIYCLQYNSLFGYAELR